MLFRKKVKSFQDYKDLAAVTLDVTQAALALAEITRGASGLLETQGLLYKHQWDELLTPERMATLQKLEQIYGQGQIGSE